MKKVQTILFGISILISCNGRKIKQSEGYSGAKYIAQSTLEGSTKQYLEFNFITDSLCEIFRNQYDVESDKLYNYEGSKKNYKYYLENKHLVFVKTGVYGQDTIRLEIRGDNLVWHYGNVSKGLDGYPQIELSRY